MDGCQGNSMNLERTLILLKPDALKRGLAGEILSRIERKQYRISHAKTMLLTEQILREHYAHIADKPFFPQLLIYMTSGQVMALIVEGENVIAGTRQLMGATRFEDFQAGTIRGDFATTTTENLIHGSDSPETAEVEIKRFFG